MRTPSLAPTRPNDRGDQSAIILAYLIMRLTIGVLGLLLPILLIVGDIFLLKGGATTRGSLSAYYHSGMRDVFVAILGVAGFFLITYKILEWTWENTASVVAGVAAIGVAIFPTGLPDGSSAAPTPLQDRLGEGATEVIHFVCAGTFILLLAVLSIGFGHREREREGRRVAPAGHPRSFRSSVLHYTCAGVILAAVASIFVFRWLGWFDGYEILIGEVVSLLAFGISWLAKGYERNLLKRYRPSELTGGGWPLRT